MNATERLPAPAAIAPVTTVRHVHGIEFEFHPATSAHAVWPMEDEPGFVGFRHWKRLAESLAESARG